MTVQKTIAAAAAVVVLVLLIGGGWYAYSVSTAKPVAGPDLVKDDPGAVTGVEAAPTASTHKLKVGVVISLHSAAEVFNGSPRGYKVQTRIVPDLDAPDIDLIPVIEAGSETDVNLKEQLQQLFPLAKPILDNDAAGLRSLQVIVAAEVWAPTDQLVANLDAAVNDGVRFFNDGISDPSGYNSPTHHGRNLAGLIDNAHFASPPNPVPCTCIENHPILGDLWGFPDIQLRPLGIMGQLPPEAKPLVKVTNPSDVSGAQR